MEYEFIVDGLPARIGLDKKGDGFVIGEGDAAFEAEIRAVAPDEIAVLTGGRRRKVFIARRGDLTFVSVDGRTYTLETSRPDSGRSSVGEDPETGGILHVKAPMPGKVIQVGVAEGDDVRKNQTLVIVEAMKMENEIKSAAAGVVKKIHCCVGDLVDSRKPLIEVETKV